MASLLVVDDNASIRCSLKDVLDLEHKTFEAGNGEEAITILTEHEIDLMILDLNMPITNGWETLRIVRDQQNGWPELRVIMLTVHDEPENTLKAWMLGVSYYITKPFEPCKVHEYVNFALGEPLPLNYA